MKQICFSECCFFSTQYECLLPPFFNYIIFVLHLSVHGYLEFLELWAPYLTNYFQNMSTLIIVQQGSYTCV